jgi:hypothetical protein
MILILALVVVFSFLYYFVGWPYALGMSEYVSLNNNGSIQSENTWISIRNEYREFLDAIRARDYTGAFMEFFDILHATTKSLIVTFTAKIIYYHWLCWILLFPLLLPATIKLGYRYNKYKCIRNHSRINKDHVCIINRYL